VKSEGGRSGGVSGFESNMMVESRSRAGRI